MTDLTTKYMGLELKNPIIIGSCSLTSNIEDIVQIEQNGAAAIVLKSLFEEEILNEAATDLKDAEKNKLIYSQLSETLDYIDIHTKEKRLSEYLKLIGEAKKKTLIPIIASINCITDSEWTDFASKIQDAGADGLELNIFLNPIDLVNKDYEKTTQRIIKKVLKTVTIPVAIKLSDCFTNLSNVILELSTSGIAGIVMFNRFYTPDIDIYNLNIIAGKMHSCDNEYTKPLRWIALLSDKIKKCSIAASTGIHDGNTAIKQILAGADAVQVVSAIYLNGKKHINQMLTDMGKWMFDKGFFSLKQFQGLASYKNASNPAVFERMQFMKYYGRIG
jgi:dihydroorotate dehydrogenase (fumarate)